VRIGLVILPQLRWSEQAALWQRTESLGFDHVWTYDHLSWYSLAAQPWFATVPTLAAASLVTSTIPLGTWVATPGSSGRHGRCRTPRSTWSPAG
jgi:alkanesulfonate monooxygenase SsuD/methylene tetrahydromethanopterin reductase-like flavin-dependent oxidoreductase (luciferase family)